MSEARNRLRDRGSKITAQGLLPITWLLENILAFFTIFIAVEPLKTLMAKL